MDMIKRVLCAGWMSIAVTGAVRSQAPVPRPPPDLGAEAVTALPSGLDLETAIALARRYSPAIRLAEAQSDEQSEREVEIRGLRGPSLGLASRFQSQDEGIIESFGGGALPQTESWQGGVEVRQPVYRGGSLKAAGEAQNLRALASRETVRATRYDVMLETAQVFFRALLAREVVGVQEESLRLLEEQSVLATNRFEAGAGSRFDALQAEVAARNAAPPLLRARTQARLAIEELRRVIGLPFAPGQGPEAVEIQGGWPFPRIDFSADDALAAALTHRPELAALERQREAGEKDLDVVRGERRPQIDLTAGYAMRSRQFGDGLGDTVEGWEVGVQASLPIFTSGRNRSRIRQAASRLTQVDLQETAFRQAIEVEVATAYAEWQVALDILQTSDTVIGLAEEALRQARHRFEAGAITQMDILQSELGLTQARLEKARASHDYNLAVARLNRAMGIFAPGERIELPGGNP